MPTAIRSDKIDLSLEKNTEKLAAKFSKKLKPGHIIFLYGEMGVGKTTFIRYLINSFQKANKLKITDFNRKCSVEQGIFYNYHTTTFHQQLASRWNYSAKSV